MALNYPGMMPVPGEAGYQRKQGYDITTLYGPEGNPNFQGTPAWNKLHGVPGAAGGTAGSTNGMPSMVSDPFKKAIDTLSGAGSDVEQMYQRGKRRTLSDIAMQSVNAGMANTLNMPAAGMAYEEAVRPGTNVAVAGQKAGIYQNLGQAGANIYGTNVGAETSRYGTNMAFQSDQMNRDLKKYLAELEAKYGSKGGGGVTINNIGGGGMAPRLDSI